jgi:prepilin-type processing-associated H-X9-DG protein/prepilin-type N-terminal cleavage/methylation domain-containing protein
MTTSEHGTVSPHTVPRRPAFTLVELLVVIGIIAVMMALLMPALAAARRQGQLVVCQSNLRQLVVGIEMFKNENKGRFPPNRGGPGGGEYWHQDALVGGYLAPAGIAKGRVFSCPVDDDSRLSYSMNIWTSSAIDDYAYGDPPVGCLWGPSPRDSSRVMLLVESWSFKDSSTGGYSALPAVGNRGNAPGPRFGGGAGLPTLLYAYRFGPVNSELDYSRHRPRGSWARSTQPGGMVNIAFADGHVAAMRESELYHSDNGRSTLDALWSPLDHAQNGGK